MTWDYRGLQRGYKWLQAVTSGDRGYKGLQEVKRGDRGLQGVTGGYKALKECTRDYKG